MKKRIGAVALCFFMAISLLPVVALADGEVAETGGVPYNTLQEAINNAADGATVTLLADVTTESIVLINKSVTLDLNNHTIKRETTTGNTTINIAGGSVVITDTSNEKNGSVVLSSNINDNSKRPVIVQSGASLEIKAGTISGNDYGLINLGTAKVTGGKISATGTGIYTKGPLTVSGENTLIEGVEGGILNYCGTVEINGGTIRGTSSVDGSGDGIFILGDGTDGSATLTINGGQILSDHYFAITGRGNLNEGGTVINITNGTVKTESNTTPAIYHPQKGVLTISGGTITGGTGVEIRAGTLNVSGGTITGTGSPVTVTPNGNGSTSDGAGIAVAQHTTKLNLAVNISGGAISGYSAVYESNPQENTSADIEKVTLFITGGSFKTINGGKAVIYSQDKSEFITAGYFSDEPDNSYIITSKDAVTNNGDNSNKYPFTIGDPTAVTGDLKITSATKAEGDGDWTQTVTTADPTESENGKITITQAIVCKDNNDKKIIGTALSNWGFNGFDYIVVLKLDTSDMQNVVSTTNVTCEDNQWTRPWGEIKDADNTLYYLVGLKQSDIDAGNDGKVSFTFKNGSTAAKTFTYDIDARALATSENVTVDPDSKVTVVPTEPKAGDTVTIKPAAGKEITAAPTVGYPDPNDSTKTIPVDVTKQDDGTYTFKMPPANVTVSAPTKDIPSTSGGGGGVAQFGVSVADTTNGTVKTDKTSAAKDAKVTLTVKPDEGYKLDKLTVKDSSDQTVTAKDNGDGTWTFTMPAAKVTVTATFVKDETQPTPTPSDNEKFVDVPKDAYYHDAVYWAVDKGITQGTDATHFAPDATCTRAQMVTFLWRAAGQPAPASSENPFTDVKEGAYYYDAVLWAVENGITVGTSSTTFSPDDTVIRGQAVTFLWRCEGKPAPATTENPFTDVTSSDYFYQPVLWAVEKNVTAGTSKTTFSPQANCLRSQVVTFLNRAAGQE